MTTTEPPIQIDSLRVLRKLGEGGMGTVYACADEERDETVAVKVLLPALALDPEMVERFAREARALLSVDSPHVVKALRVGSWTGGPFLVMELLKGETLFDRMAQRGRLPIDEAVRFMTQAAQGLRAASKAGLVHRDVKPDNLFVTGHGIKVVDFGLARPIDGSANLTATGLIVGSAAYMAPERSRGEDASIKSDIYALGASLFEVLAGRAPYEADTEIEVLSAHIMKPLPALSDFRTEVPPVLAELVQRMLDKDPAQRVGTYDAVLAVLERIVTTEHDVGGTQPMQKAQEASSIAAPFPSGDDDADQVQVTIRLPRHPARVWLEATSALFVWARQSLRTRGARLWREQRMLALAGIALVVGLSLTVLVLLVLPAKEGQHASAANPVNKASGKDYPEDDIRGWSVDELAEFLADRDVDDILQELKKRPSDSVHDAMVTLVQEGSYLQRHRALAILDENDLATDALQQRVAVRDIENGPTCEARREGVDRLLEYAADEGALDAVQRLRRRASSNSCIDLDAAESVISDRIDR